MTRHVRFIHAADMHLGARFERVSASAESAVATELISSRSKALTSLIDLCIEHAVDFLVIAGDLFDEGGRSAKAHFDAQRELARLGERGIAVYMVHGNHDPADASDFGVAMPSNVRVFSHETVERVEHQRDGEVVCALYGRSFPKATVKDNYVAQVKRDGRDTIAIGVMHADVGAGEGSTYAPCSLGDLQACGLDYWALGHIHKHDVLANNIAVYPGSTQGLDPNEPGAHGCVLVELAAGAEPSIRFVPLDSIRWIRRAVDVSGCATVADVQQALTAAVEEARAESDGRSAVARVTLTGRTEAHRDIAPEAIAADLLEEAQARGMGSQPWVWVERIVDETRPVLDMDALGKREDFIGDLVRLAGAVDPQEILDQAAGDLFSRAGRDMPQFDARAVLERAAEECVDLLRKGAS